MSIYNDGRQAWYDGKGFIHNPFNICSDASNFQDWSKGWWEVQDQMCAADSKKILEEMSLEDEQYKRELVEKEKAKTKQGRLELAGQSVLF